MAMHRPIGYDDKCRMFVALSNARDSRDRSRCNTKPKRVEAALSGVSIFIGALLVGGVFFFVLLALGEISESLSDVRKTLTDINETLSMNSAQKGAISAEELIEDDSE